MGQLGIVTERYFFTTLPYPSLPLGLYLFSYRLKQYWLGPIVDFSIPPEQVFAWMPAKEFLELDLKQQGQFPQSVVMIAPGGYSEAGIDNSDNFSVPAAIRYWRKQQTPEDQRDFVPGGEIHAYTFHHYLNQSTVVPIPNLWLILAGVVAGKVAAIAVQDCPRHRRWRWGVGLVIATASYGLMSLQLYVSAGIMLPILLPAATVWVCVLPRLIEEKNYG